MTKLKSLICESGVCGMTDALGISICGGIANRRYWGIMCCFGGIIVGTGRDLSLQQEVDVIVGTGRDLSVRY